MSGYQHTSPASKTWYQGFGCASLSNIIGTAISPFDWETNATNIGAAAAVNALFPLQGGSISTLSVYYISAVLAVDVVWSLRVNGVNQPLSGTILAGSQGPLLVQTVVNLPAGLNLIQLQAQAAAAPGSGVIRVRAAMTGQLN